MYVVPGLALAFLDHVPFWSVPLCQASPDATVFYYLEFLLRLQDSPLGVWPAQTICMLLLVWLWHFWLTYNSGVFRYAKHHLMLLCSTTWIFYCVYRTVIWEFGQHRQVEAFCECMTPNFTAHLGNTRPCLAGHNIPTAF